MATGAEGLSADLAKRLDESPPLRFNSETEYFFLLGQALTTVFTVMGGADNYRREFNYLSNPSVRLGAAALGRRVIHFLGKVPERVELPDRLTAALNALLDPANLGYLERVIDPVRCEQAFYEGLYDKNDLGK